LQANAILDLQLRRLAALERKKIETEYKEVTATIKRFERRPIEIRQANARRGGGTNYHASRKASVIAAHTDRELERAARKAQRQ